MVGDSSLSHPYDCSVYLVDAGELVLIDCGAGLSYNTLIDNIKSTGRDIRRLKAILVTHAHIDHIGALKRFKDEFGVDIIAHQLDAKAIETGRNVGAEMYGVDYEPCQVNTKIESEEQIIGVGGKEIRVLHIPGHTQGSIAAYIDSPEGRILFGQDIHGPYIPQWGADIEKARESLRKLIDLKADTLCEGHFGIYRPAKSVEQYIRGYLNGI